MKKINNLLDTLNKSQETGELELERDIPPIALAKARIQVGKRELA